jgi:hypothetical protein
MWRQTGGSRSQETLVRWYQQPDDATIVDSRFRWSRLLTLLFNRRCRQVL